MLCARCVYPTALIPTTHHPAPPRPPAPPAQVWDIRMPERELAALYGHSYAVRRVLFSPHAPTVIASCSYDMTVRLWDYAAPEDALLRMWDHHSEFAVGLDFSVLTEGLLASAGWDDTTWVWHQSQDPRGG